MDPATELKPITRENIRLWLQAQPADRVVFGELVLTDCLVATWAKDHGYDLELCALTVLVHRRNGQQIQVELPNDVAELIREVCDLHSNLKRDLTAGDLRAAHLGWPATRVTQPES